jgi:hypothetical protein
MPGFVLNELPEFKEEFIVVRLDVEGDGYSWPSIFNALVQHVATNTIPKSVLLTVTGFEADKESKRHNFIAFEDTAKEKWIASVVRPYAAAPCKSLADFHYRRSWLLKQLSHQIKNTKSDVKIHVDNITINVKYAAERAKKLIYARTHVSLAA